jgi:cell fate regulator YaaT (PSP1 superfamily)
VANKVGVRFRPKGKIVYCGADGMSLEVNDYVIVDTGHGLDLAKVATLEIPPEENTVERQSMLVLRKANEEDLKKARRQLEEEALRKCKEIATKLGLSMKPLRASYNFGTDHLTVLFSAQEKVDFRNLLRKLSHAMEVKVELRQVGARDEARILGGIGKCGYTLCCQSFLTSFASVSIKMAKEQNLALNPMKISGICGKLLCCLTYEREEYAAMKEKMPRVNQEVLTVWGKGKVVSVNYLTETIKVQLEDETTKEVTLDQLIESR